MADRNRDDAVSQPLGQDGPLISIVIPFLNVEAFIGEAIESVLVQTYPIWELTLVDDGSVDGSRAVAERYARGSPERIRCVQHEGNANRGVSASRNLGRHFSRGDYIAYLDADDLWLPDKLERQVAVLSAQPRAGMIIGATRYWRSWTGEPGEADAVFPVGGPQDTLVSPPDLATILYPLGTGRAPSANTILIRADLLDEVGGWEDRFRTAFEDQALLTKIYLSAPVYISSECYDLYRQCRPGSITQNELLGQERYRHRYQFYKWLERYMREKGLQSSPAWPLLMDRLRRPEFRRYRYPLLWRVKQTALRLLPGSRPG